MLKRITCVICVFTMLLGACGCSALFANQYQSEQDFQGNEKIDLDANMQVVQNYSELRRLIFGMVNKHEETKELLFSGYTGNVVSDIASVCNAVKTESSFGAYCVDFISYDLRQIVSSYEANINISYLYTAEELSVLQTTSNLDSFSQLFAQVLEREESKLVVRVNNGVSDADTVQELMQRTARNHPLKISYLPKFSVKIFDGNTSQKIYDVSIQYDPKLDNAARLQEMESVITTMLSSLKESEPEHSLLAAAEILNEHCSYVPESGDTAYEALINGTADSRGISCGFKAVCDRMDVECLVVAGQMDKQPHFWNIVKIGEAYYHMDISLMQSIGKENALFLSDTKKQVNCWWDQSEYPACDGELRYDDLIEIE